MCLFRYLCEHISAKYLPRNMSTKFSNKNKKKYRLMKRQVDQCKLKVSKSIIPSKPSLSLSLLNCPGDYCFYRGCRLCLKAPQEHGMISSCSPSSSLSYKTFFNCPLLLQGLRTLCGSLASTWYSIITFFIIIIIPNLTQLSRAWQQTRHPFSLAFGLVTLHFTTWIQYIENSFT